MKFFSYQIRNVCFDLRGWTTPWTGIRAWRPNRHERALDGRVELERRERLGHVVVEGDPTPLIRLSTEEANLPETLSRCPGRWQGKPDHVPGAA